MNSRHAPPKPTVTWRQAWLQAQADLAKPAAVVWLGTDIAQAIRAQQPAAPDPPTPPRYHRSLWPALLLTGLLLLPATLSYIGTYRRLIAVCR
jgi:hypothetical protein